MQNLEVSLDILKICFWNYLENISKYMCLRSENIQIILIVEDLGKISENRIYITCRGSFELLTKWMKLVSEILNSSLEKSDSLYMMWAPSVENL